MSSEQQGRTGMEKKTPHTRLHIVKSLVEQGKMRTTAVASLGANSLGLNFEDIKQVVLGLTPKDFYKSMTSYDNSKIWHDVYRPTFVDCQVYLKFTVSDDVLVVSFKER